MVWPITLRGPSLARSCYGPNCGQVNALRGELTFNPPPTLAGNASRSERIPGIEMPRECPPASVLSQQASTPLRGAGGTFDQGCGSSGACVSRKSRRCGEGAGGSGGGSVYSPGLPASRNPHGIGHSECGAWWAVMPFSLVILAGCDRAERRLVGSGPTKRRAVPSAPGVGRTRHPKLGAAEQPSVAYGNHQEISDLRNLLRYGAPEQRSPLTCYK